MPRTLARAPLAAVLALLAWGAASSAAAAQAPEPVAFRSGELELQGFLWLPRGTGTFPALLWNHGSEKLPGALPGVAPVFVERGFAFFVPHRRGQGRSPGPYVMDELARAANPTLRGMRLVELMETQLQDQLAALAYLQSHPAVDRHRIAVMGHSFGGIQTLLAAEQQAGYRVAIDCSGASEVWRTSEELRARLVSAARRASIPVMFLQAENDHDLAPNRVLSAAVGAAGQTVEAKVYPRFGTGAAGGHSFCVLGGAIWAPDVLRFIVAHLG